MADDSVAVVCRDSCRDGRVQAMRVTDRSNSPPRDRTANRPLNRASVLVTVRLSPPSEERPTGLILIDRRRFSLDSALSIGERRRNVVVDVAFVFVLSAVLVRRNYSVGLRWFANENNTSSLRRWVSNATAALSLARRPTRIDRYPAWVSGSKCDVDSPCRNWVRAPRPSDDVKNRSHDDDWIETDVYPCSAMES